MTSARVQWPDVPASWTDKDPADIDWFVFDVTGKLSERSGAVISGTPTFSCTRDDGGTADLTFSSVTVNAAGTVVTFLISGGTAGHVYKVTMAFLDTSGRTLDRSELLAISAR